MIFWDPSMVQKTILPDPNRFLFYKNCSTMVLIIFFFQSKTKSGGPIPPLFLSSSELVQFGISWIFLLFLLEHIFLDRIIKIGARPCVEVLRGLVFLHLFELRLRYRQFKQSSTWFILHLRFWMKFARETEGSHEVEDMMYYTTKFRFLAKPNCKPNLKFSKKARTKTSYETHKTGWYLDFRAVLTPSSKHEISNLVFNFWIA